MIVSEYIARFLVEKGIRDVFLLDGSAAASLIVAVAKNKNLKYYCPLHEQAGSFMVDGYFKASRRMSVMIATSGPGGQNLLNGIAASYYDSCPAIYFTGQVNSRFIKPNNLIRQRGFQENDIISMVKPVTKYAVLITDPVCLPYELEKAYQIAISGRPGPVVLDIPMDIQRSRLSGGLRHYSIDIPQKNELEKVSVVLDLLERAKRPVVLLGGGIWLAGAIKDAEKLALLLKRVPFLVTWNMIDYYQPKYFGGKVGTFGGDGRNFAIQNSDLLLSIGSRISGRVTGGMIKTFARSAKKIIVDIDPNELKYQQVKGDLNICCDAKIFIRELIKYLRSRSSVIKSVDQYWLERVQGWRVKYKVVRDEYWKQKASVNPYVFVEVLSVLMAEGDILVHEAGGNCVITSQAFQPKAKQRVFTNNGNSSLGYSFPAAIGAAIAARKRIICITGDGGMNFNIQELQTLKQYNLAVKVFIFCNDVFGITKAYRDTHFNSEYAGVDKQHGISFPDFVKIAKAYGLKGVRIDNHCDLKRKIANVLNTKGSVICSVNMVGFYDYQPKLGWGTPIEDQYPFLPRDEFRKNMIIQPHKGWENPVYPGPVK